MGSFTAACSMVRRSGVTFLLIVILFAVSDGRRKFEETSKKCSEYFECVHRSACEQYNQRYAEYKQTNNVEIITELKALICNKRKRAVCCRQESQESCGKPQKIPESIINGTKTSPGEFPFSGLIGYEKKDVYRGTLASGRRICGVPEVELETCQQSLSVDRSHVCAGAELGKDACSGSRERGRRWSRLIIMSIQLQNIDYQNS